MHPSPAASGPKICVRYNGNIYHFNNSCNKSSTVVCLSAVCLPLKQFQSVTLRMSNLLLGIEKAIWCSILPYIIYRNHLICGAPETI